MPKHNVLIIGRSKFFSDYQAEVLEALIDKANKVELESYCLPFLGEIWEATSMRNDLRVMVNGTIQQLDYTTFVKSGFIISLAQHPISGCWFMFTERFQSLQEFMKDFKLKGTASLLDFSSDSF